MSADNGTLIEETAPDIFEVRYWQGESFGRVLAGGQSLKEAILIAQRQETEYGIRFKWYEKPYTINTFLEDVRDLIEDGDPDSETVKNLAKVVDGKSNTEVCTKLGIQVIGNLR